MYKIKLGINNKTKIKPKENFIYPGVEQKYRQKGSWNSSVYVEKNYFTKKRNNNLNYRYKSLNKNNQIRKSEIKELTLNNFDSLTGFETVFTLIKKQKDLMLLEVKIMRKKSKIRIKKF